MSALFTFRAAESVQLGPNLQLAAGDVLKLGNGGSLVSVMHALLPAAQAERFGSEVLQLVACDATPAQGRRCHTLAADVLAAALDLPSEGEPPPQGWWARHTAASSAD